MQLLRDFYKQDREVSGEILSKKKSKTKSVYRLQKLVFGP